MFRRILVPIDGSPTSNRGLDEAIGLASDQKAKICLLHVIDELVLSAGADGMVCLPSSYVDEFIRALRADGKALLAHAEARVRKRGIAVESVLQETVGKPVADLIIKQAKKWDADLIVLGTHGRRGLSRVFMGSDAETVVRETTLPVLLVRSPVSPRKRRARRG
ncbi:MAG TPA: universal stress protein [Casimicrobiaceae bacterium]|jgi:nucleotide-binding universal stress UspA family protein|nr:universal stress protein [Casimicrobiaceae bacterium]